ncbi:MAG: hypothetical protein RBT01_09175 [Anaerolineaceae bacterium]|nr:hypothetical protein [Anaerolineaceae bacterium]
MLIILISLVVIYAFFNGYRDSSSILAGVIASRAMNPRLALYLVERDTFFFHSCTDWRFASCNNYF